MMVGHYIKCLKQIMSCLIKKAKFLRSEKIYKKPDSKIGEFLGLMKLSRKGSKVFLDKNSELEISHQGKFHNAPSLEKAYLTDMLQELIVSGIRISPIYVSGKWCEIDTPQDLKIAQKIFVNNIFNII